MRTIGTTGGQGLRLATLWDAQRLVAVMPLVVRHYRGVRLLEWVGARVTDYCDALIDSHIDGAAAVRMLWEELERHGDFDIGRLGHVRTDAAAYAFLEGLRPWVETREEAYAIPLQSGNGEDWVNQQSTRLRSNIRQRMRQMAKLGYRFQVCTSAAEAESIVHAAIEQKRAWVAARSVPSFIAEPQGAQFVQALAAEMARSGSLRLSAVRSPERVAACHIGFVRRGVFYFYMPTYDRSLGNHGFGSALRDALIMWACDSGLSKFDLLLGADDYKSQYQPVAQAVRTLLVPRSLIGRVALAYYRISSGAGGNGIRRIYRRIFSAASHTVSGPPP